MWKNPLDAPAMPVGNPGQKMMGKYEQTTQELNRSQGRIYSIRRAISYEGYCTNVLTSIAHLFRLTMRSRYVGDGQTRS